MRISDSPDIIAFLQNGQVNLQDALAERLAHGALGVYAPRREDILDTARVVARTLNYQASTLPLARLPQLFVMAAGPTAAAQVFGMETQAERVEAVRNLMAAPPAVEALNIEMVDPVEESGAVFEAAAAASDRSYALLKDALALPGVLNDISGEDWQQLIRTVGESVDANFDRYSPEQLLVFSLRALPGETGTQLLASPQVREMLVGAASSNKEQWMVNIGVAEPGNAQSATISIRLPPHQRIAEMAGMAGMEGNAPNVSRPVRVDSAEARVIGRHLQQLARAGLGEQPPAIRLDLSDASRIAYDESAAGGAAIAGMAPLITAATRAVIQRGSQEEAEIPTTTISAGMVGVYRNGNEEYQPSMG